VLSKLTPGMSFSTLELKVAYHKAITKDTGPVRAGWTIATMGRRAAFTDARLVDVHGRLYTSAASSLLVTHPT
jgi:acyl-coenzyme A thioesterase PaaI-like protein